MNKSKKIFCLLIIGVLFTFNVDAASTIEVSMVKDINPGSNTSYFSGFPAPKSLNGQLYFPADEGIHGLELWKTDGTEGNTNMVKDIRLGNSADLAYLTDLNGTLFFAARDEEHGQELWKSDGTVAGTRLVKDIFPGEDTSLPREITILNDNIYFGARKDRNLYGLWKSDGTAEGTIQVHSFTEPPANLVTINGLLYFTVGDVTPGSGLWKSDGTNTGTVLVKNTGSNTELDLLRHFSAANNFLFFTATDDIHGNELWRTDGTESGTILVKDINPGISTSSSRNLIAFQGDIYFSASEGTGGQLWKSNGTEAGTYLVKNIRLGSSNPSNFKVVNDTLYFYARDDNHGEELWKTDGSEAGTVLVKDIYPGELGSIASGFIVGLLDSASLNNILYFSATDGVNGFEVWRSDGTSEGTFMIKDIQIGSQGSFPKKFTEVNGVVYFMADNGINGVELWAIKPENYSPKATFVFDSALLELPVIQVVDNKFNASLRLTNTQNDSFNFMLEDARITASTSEHSAIFSLQDGSVAIPTINLFQKGKLIGHTDAELELIDGTNPLQFKLIHVGDVHE